MPLNWSRNWHTAASSIYYWISGSLFSLWMLSRGAAVCELLDLVASNNFLLNNEYIDLAPSGEKTFWCTSQKLHKSVSYWENYCHKLFFYQQQMSFLHWCILILDYAVKIFHDALKRGHHECYLGPDTRLPMMYIDDCLRSISEYMVVPREKLQLCTYNVNAMSFSPSEVAEEIKKHYPDFKITYRPDSRQQIGGSTRFIFLQELYIHLTI